MSNSSPDQNRNLKPTLPPHQNAYSASPNHLTLQSDMPPGNMQNPGVYGHNPYSGYVPQHEAFFPPPQSQYRTPLQTRHPTIPPPPQLLAQQQQQPQQHSPTQNSNNRKRRASDIGGEPMLHGPPGGNSGQYGSQPGLMGPPGDLDVNLQGNQPNPNPVTSPVVKKGRTNTPWSPAEEHRLKLMRDQGSSWSEIAKQFPNRTEGSVKKHWYKDMHYADFGEDESTALLQAIKEYETNKWKVIGQKVGKPAKACEQFAKEQGWKI